jgi:hypothetical protein
MEDKKQAWPETPAVAKDSAAGICLFISVSVRLDVSMSVSESVCTVCTSLFAEASAAAEKAAAEKVAAEAKVVILREY